MQIIYPRLDTSDTTQSTEIISQVWRVEFAIFSAVCRRTSQQTDDSPKYINNNYILDKLSYIAPDFGLSERRGDACRTASPRSTPRRPAARTSRSPAEPRSDDRHRGRVPWAGRS